MNKARSAGRPASQNRGDKEVRISTSAVIGAIADNLPVVVDVNAEVRGSGAGGNPGRDVVHRSAGIEERVVGRAGGWKWSHQPRYLAAAVDREWGAAGVTVQRRRVERNSSRRQSRRRKTANRVELRQLCNEVACWVHPSSKRETLHCRTLRWIRPALDRRPLPRCTFDTIVRCVRRTTMFLRN